MEITPYMNKCSERSLALHIRDVSISIYVKMSLTAYMYIAKDGYLTMYNL